MLDVIHHRDVAAALAAERAAAVSDWAWQRQLRYYGRGATAAVAVAMVDAEFEYTWEYQGNAPKLVYTPLTDRCYLTLTQGMALGYGGNPYGPAGTGKTESVKALGQVRCRHGVFACCWGGEEACKLGSACAGAVCAACIRMAAHCRVIDTSWHRYPGSAAWKSSAWGT